MGDINIIDIKNINDHLKKILLNTVEDKDDIL